MGGTVEVSHGSIGLSVTDKKNLLVWLRAVFGNKFDWWKLLVWLRAVFGNKFD